MLDYLSERIGRKAEALAAARLGVLAERAEAGTPDDVAVARGSGVIILTGPGLRARLLSDPDLRAWVREWAR